ncbi:MAG: fibronectin type III domain-containing protein [Bacilli bacterium]|nr:fibronectin type III domain-containing protein [Bacilli bacterium]
MRKKFLLLMPILAILIMMCFTLKVNAAVQKFDLIYTNPAEDSSTSMRFNWHSTFSACIFHYTVESDPEFAYETTKVVVGKENTVAYSSSLGKFYVYKMQLDNLTPDTTYIYKLTSGENESDVYRFKTAGFSGSFNFMNYGDLHSDASEAGKITVLEKLLANAEAATSEIGGLDLILSTGDTIKYGDRYSDWQEYNRSSVRRNYMLAQINGNHEQKISTAFNGYESGQSAVHDWELNTWNNPQNGVSDDLCSFWFLYNSVLFIGIDDQRGATIKAAAEWADEVLRKNEGRYQYCVVYKHNPVFRSQDTKWTDWGGYEDYSKFCDKYNVDLFLCGDDHEYVRTKQLYNDTVQTDLSKGTVYMTVPMISTSTGNLTVLDPSDSRARANNVRFAKSGNSGDTGAMYFTVTPEKLCIYTYSWNGSINDSYEIIAKRPFTARADLKEKVENSLEYVQLKGANEGIAYGDSSMTSIVKQIDFYSGTTLAGSYKPSLDKQIAFKLTGLEANKLLEIKARITYVDDTTKDVTFVANTFEYFGRISNFKAGINNGNITLNWHSELVGESVDKIHIFRNNEKVGEVDKTIESYAFAKTDADDGAKYKLALVASDGSIIGEYYCFYSALGDLNYDGAVNELDCDVISNYVYGGTLTNEQKALSDIDKDGKIDYADITYMWLHYKKNISLESNTVTVTYKALDGSTISFQEIRSGTNAVEPTAPQIEGYTFVGWTLANTAISDNVVIYPIYSK